MRIGWSVFGRRIGCPQGFAEEQRISIDLKVDFEIKLDEDRYSVLGGGREFVVLNGRESSFIEAESERMDNRHFCYGAVWFELNVYEHLSAVVESARHFIEFWLLELSNLGGLIPPPMRAGFGAGGRPSDVVGAVGGVDVLSIEAKFFRA
jgi:hypothetical protein